MHVLEQHRPELLGIQMPVPVHVLFLEKLRLFGRDRARLPARPGELAAARRVELRAGADLDGNNAVLVLALYAVCSAAGHLLLPGGSHVHSQQQQ